MFINQSRFSSVIKKAYKSSGVLVGKIGIGDEYGYVLSDHKIIFFCNERYCNKYILSLIVELIGTIPLNDEVYEVTLKRI